MESKGENFVKALLSVRLLNLKVFKKIFLYDFGMYKSLVGPFQLGKYLM